MHVTLKHGSVGDVRFANSRIENNLHFSALRVLGDAPTGFLSCSMLAAGILPAL